MKQLVFTVLICLSLQVSAAEYLYLSSGETIKLHEIDLKTGKLKVLQTMLLPGAGPFTFSPDKSKAYVIARDPKAPKKSAIAIGTFDIASDGRLKQLHMAAIKMKPGDMTTDKSGNNLFGNSYRDGKVSNWKLENGIYKGQSNQEITLELKAHSVRFSPDYNFMLVPATGPNKVFQLKYDAASAKLTPNDPPFAMGPPSGAMQPRHLIWNKKLNVVYTTQERIKPGVAVWTWDPQKGTLKVIQNIITNDDETATVSNADLHLTPDNKFLYVSCRDKNKKNSSIAAFKVDPETGRLSFIKHFPCEQIPRSFWVNKSGDYLYAAGQGDHKLGVYRINKDTGHLTKVIQYETGLKPIWVESLIKE